MFDSATRTAAGNVTARIATQATAKADPSLRVDLISAQRSHAIIDIRGEGATTLFQSTIVEVDATAQRIVIDDMFPAGFKGKRGQLLTVTLRLSGNRRIEFATRLLEIRKNQGKQRYHLALPSGVTYSQRRDTYRFRLDGFAEFITGGNYLCAGYVRNISLDGLQLALQHHIALQQGDALSQLTFEIAGMQFHCSGIVRHVGTELGGQIVIGVEFDRMLRPQERMLERMLVNMHREEARAAAAARQQEHVSQAA